LWSEGKPTTGAYGTSSPEKINERAVGDSTLAEQNDCHGVRPCLRMPTMGRHSSGTTGKVMAGNGHMFG
jgi:hypothetical protein